MSLNITPNPAAISTHRYISKVSSKFYNLLGNGQYAQAVGLALRANHVLTDLGRKDDLLAFNARAEPAFSVFSNLCSPSNQFEAQARLDYFKGFYVQASANFAAAAQTQLSPSSSPGRFNEAMRFLALAMLANEMIVVLDRSQSVHPELSASHQKKEAQAALSGRLGLSFIIKTLGGQPGLGSVCDVLGDVQTMCQIVNATPTLLSELHIFFRDTDPNTYGSDIEQKVLDHLASSARRLINKGSGPEGIYLIFTAGQLALFFSERNEGFKPKAKRLFAETRERLVAVHSRSSRESDSKILEKFYLILQAQEDVLNNPSAVFDKPHASFFALPHMPEVMRSLN